MTDEEMDLLRPGRGLRWNDQRQIDELCEHSTTTGQKADRLHASLTSSLCRHEQIRRPSARRVQDEKIPGRPEGLDLTGEDTLKTKVVAGRGQHRSVRRQRHRSHGPALPDERTTYSAARCCASAADPPFPQKKMRPPPSMVP